MNGVANCPPKGEQPQDKQAAIADIAAVTTLLKCADADFPFPPTNSVDPLDSKESIIRRFAKPFVTIGYVAFSREVTNQDGFSGSRNMVLSCADDDSAGAVFDGDVIIELAHVQLDLLR